MNLKTRKRVGKWGLIAMGSGIVLTAFLVLDSKHFLIWILFIVCAGALGTLASWLAEMAQGEPK